MTIWPTPVLDLLAVGGDRPVFEDGDRVVTAAEMSTMIRRAAAGLRARGIGPGRGVALRLGVGAEAFAATIAAFAVGARVCGLPAGLTAAQREHLLSRDDAVPIDEVAFGDDEPLAAAGRPGDVARIIYTSGSTGRPKGCAQTYAAMSAAWAPCPDRWPPAIAQLAERLDRYLVFGSLSSQVMLEYGILTLAAGGVLVAARSPAFPDAFVRHRATASVITVGKLHQLVRSQRANPVDLSGLGALMVSGSPLEPGRLREALDVLGPVVFHGYGQTETGMISMATPGEMPDSVGRPPAAVSLRFEDGELYVRTPAQASFYWGDPEESAKVFTGGWVRTRDLASLGEDGYLRLLGRARDVIIVQATLVCAGPIERVLATADAVAEAYVVGRPDDETGEAIHAFVVPVTGREPDPAELRALVAARLGPLAAPKTVTVIERVPLTPSGKPDKAALAA
ncbi:class I adenylate-forming enzyme family protein [Actinoplanes siamensis]|uniref:AMP-dependent synthetase n=1 Tax=Actinoplanes siamensis TaxID=1223317 RepID=A0A919N6T6_9ACTN|nr:fatty acid--CoA ligase family protein [Actinoplanes siamensis]GIF05524.1 AMP-dependent synthetase [Actinoplanes siamensis]